MSTPVPLIVSIDTECDKSPSWHTRAPLSFRGIVEGIGARLHPLFREFGIRPTYLLSPEVMCDTPSRDLLRSLDGCELGTHLHGEYTSPGALQSLGGTLTHDMQWQYPPDLEQAKLETLTQIFVQQFGARPRSFRAGRFGIGHHTGRFLAALQYHTDSSVTPHVVWTSRDGKKFPDFRECSEVPYRVAPNGDIWEAGQSDLLEVPVTILPASALEGIRGKEPVWFRPWYSDAEILERVVTHCVEETNRTGIVRPLVMMFHNVEAVPALSPYPQSDADVRRYLDMLMRAFDHATALGVRACTFEEYYAEYMKTNPKEVNTPAARPQVTTPVLPKELALNPGDVLPVLEKHNVESWFAYIFRDRATRWDVWQPCHWIAEHLPAKSPILETGCGTGFNLLWLAEHGFTRLYGFDINENAVTAGSEIAEKAGLPVDLWVDDGLAPTQLRKQKFAAIIALNWAHLIPGMSYDRLINTYLPHLADDGVFIFDAIDVAYNDVAGNAYHTADRAKPVGERRPSEYRTRLSTKEVTDISRTVGLSLETVLTEVQEIPKKVYILRRGVKQMQEPVPVESNLHLLRADELMQQGALTASRDELFRAIGVEPERPELYTALGNVLLKMGEVAAAHDEYLKAVRKEPDSIPARMNVIATSFMLEDYASAETELLGVLERDPENLEARKLLGRAYVAAEKFTEGLTTYRDVLQRRPDDIETMLALAALYLEAGHTESTRILLERVVEVDPSNADAREILNQLLGTPDPGATMVAPGGQIISGTRQEMYDEAQRLIGEQQFEDAVTLLQQCVESFPDDAAAHNDLGALCLLLNDAGSAREHLEAAQRLSPGQEHTLRNLAELYVSVRDIPAAAATYQQILDLHPDDVEALMAVGNLCFVMKRHEDAAFFYERVLSIDATSQIAKESLEAIASATRAAAPQVAIEGTPEDQYTLAKSLIEESKLNDAERLLVAVTESQPENVDALNDLGAVRYALGDAEGALSVLTKASVLDPHNVTLLWNLVDVHVALRRVPEAMNALQAILNEQPDDTEALMAIGHLCLVLELPDDARFFYRRVLTLDPSSRIAHESLDALEARSTAPNTGNGEKKKPGPPEVVPAAPARRQPIRVVMFYDEKGWAWWHRAHHIRNAIDAGIEVTILKIGTPFRHEEFDFLLLFDHYLLSLIPPLPGWKLIIGNSCPKLIEQSAASVLRYNCAAGVVNNLAGYETARAKGANFYCCQNGVDTDLFTPAEHPPEELIACWVGNSKSMGNKGLDLIEAACRKAGVRLRTVDAAEKAKGVEANPQDWVRDELYRKSSVYICASEYEGTPNPALEAMACGLPVISTRVGNMVELIRDGHNGFLVDRSVDAIAAALRKMKKSGWKAMGKNALASILNGWTWKQQALKYEAMFRELVAKEIPGRHPEPHAAGTDIALSFVVITGGKRNDLLNAVVRSIQAQGIPEYEIIVSGAYHEAPGIVYVDAPEAAASGRLGEMRNAALAVARFDTFVILDDDIILADGWYDSCRNYAGAFDILTSQIRLPDGGRYWDHATFGGERGQIVLNDGEQADFLYMTGGGAWLLRRYVWETVRWDSALGFYQGEDTDYARRCVAYGFSISHNHGSLAYHADATYTLVGRSVQRRTDGKTQAWSNTLRALSPGALLAQAKEHMNASRWAELCDALRIGLLLHPQDRTFADFMNQLEQYFGGRLDGTAWFPEGDPAYRKLIERYMSPQTSLPAGGKTPATKRGKAADARTVGVDARTLFHGDSMVRGIGQYSIHHLKALAGAKPDWHFILYGTGASPSEQVKQLIDLPNVELRSAGEYTPGDVDIVHVCDIMDIMHGGGTRPLDLFHSRPATATFYDLIPLRIYFDSWTEPHRQAYMRALDHVRSGSCRLLAISQHTATDVVQHAGISSDRVSTILAGLNVSGTPCDEETAQQVRERYGITTPYFLRVGSLDDHKNFEIELNAFRECAKKQPCQFVVVGDLSFHGKETRERVGGAGIDGVIFTGFVPRLDLDALYRGARGLLALSRYEGFGFPVLEAMGNDCPVIASDVTSIPEVAGEAALLVHPNDPKAAAAAMKRLLGEDLLHANLRARGRSRAQEFTWERTANATVRVWEEMLTEHPQRERQSGIVWASSWLNPSGYTSEAMAFARGLEGRVRPEAVNISTIRSEEFLDGLTENLKGFLRQHSVTQPSYDGKIVVCHAPAYAFERKPGARYMIGRTMFETDSLPAEWVEGCNRMDEVWVPSRFNAKTFADAGVVAEKIHIVPGAVDTDLFNPAAPLLLDDAPPEGYNFLSVFEWSERKGWDVLLRAYFREFTASDPVCLTLKTYLLHKPDVNAKQFFAAQIASIVKEMGLSPRALPKFRVRSTQVPFRDLPSFYRMFDCLVAPSRGEGWGRPHAEAMAMGMPVIATRWSGNTEFMSDDNSYLIDVEKIVPISSGEVSFYRGHHWAEPSVAHLQSLMREVFNNRETAAARGKRARRDIVEKFSTHAVGALVADRLAAIGVNGDIPPALPETSGWARTPELRWACSIDYSGYSRMSRDCVIAARATDMIVSLDVIKEDDQFVRQMKTEHPEDYAALRAVNAVTPQSPVYVVCHPPTFWNGQDFYDLHKQHGSRHSTYVGLTMFETDRLPNGWAAACNKLDEVWVPSAFNVDVFTRGGVNPAKLRVIPFGIDTDRYHREKVTPLQIPGRKGFVFLSVFQWSDRKGWDVLLRAYLSAFRSSDDVSLVLRTYPSPNQTTPIREQIAATINEAGLTPASAPSVILLEQFVGEREMPSLYAAADAFILPTRGEALGIPFMEAMAMELPVIATRWGGHLDFMSDENSFLISTDGLVEATPAQVRENPFLAGGHHWANPSVSHTAALMKQVFTEREKSVTIGQRARRTIVEERPMTKTAAWIHDRVAALAAGPSAEQAPSALNIRWEGPQFVRHSLALVNRQLCQGLIRSGCALSVLPVGEDEFTPGKSNPMHAVLDKYRAGLSAVDVHVRHHWPPNLTAPAEGHWVVIQPWEFGSLPVDWVKTFTAQVDEVWAYSEYVRQVYVASGMPADRVAVVPLGVDTARFHPGVKRLKLKTKKKFRFLFVGGTIFRKGIDLLLDAYTGTFTRKDDVCLVIKDMGGQSFYKGQTAREEIDRLSNDANAPEILYLDRMLTDEELAGLYTACDVLVHPYRGEGFGLPILEAMACGTPAIVTNGGAALDFCTNDNSILVAAERKRYQEKNIGGMETVDFPWLFEVDPEALRTAMRQSHADRDRVATLGKQAASDAAQWTWDRGARVIVERVRILRDKPVVRNQAPAGDGQVRLLENAIRVATARVGSADYPEALRMIGFAERLLRTGVTSPRVQPYDVAMLKGDVYLKSEDLQQSREAYEAALHLRPDSADACRQLGVCFELAGVEDAAKKMFAMAADLAHEVPADPEVHQ